MAKTPTPHIGALEGEIADKVSVYFSGSYITKFNYDAESGRYLKFNRDNPNIDEKTGKQYTEYVERIRMRPLS